MISRLIIDFDFSAPIEENVIIHSFICHLLITYHVQLGLLVKKNSYFLALGRDLDF